MRYTIADLPRYGGHIVPDFANTVAGIGEADPRDYLQKIDDARIWAERTGFTLEGDGLASLVNLRGRITGILSGVANGSSPTSAELDWLADSYAKARPCLCLSWDDDHLVWSLPNQGDVRTLEDRLVVETVWLLEGPDAARLRQCHGPQCGWVFIDRSKSVSRQWCSMRFCGNRAKARRFRSDHPGS